MNAHYRSAEVDTYETRHKVFCDTYRNAVHNQVKKFLGENRRKYISSTYWTEASQDPWRQWETLHYISLTYKRPMAYFG